MCQLCAWQELSALHCTYLGMLGLCEHLLAPAPSIQLLVTSRCRYKAPSGYADTDNIKGTSREPTCLFVRRHSPHCWHLRLLLECPFSLQVCSTVRQLHASLPEPHINAPSLLLALANVARCTESHRPARGNSVDQKTGLIWQKGTSTTPSLQGGYASAQLPECIWTVPEMLTGCREDQASPDGIAAAAGS